MNGIKNETYDLLVESHEKLACLQQIKHEIDIAFELKNRKRLKELYQLLEGFIVDWDPSKRIKLYPADTMINRIKSGLKHSAGLFLDSNDIAFNASPILAGLSMAGVISPVLALTLIIGVVISICLPSTLLKYNRAMSKEELKDRTRRYKNDLEELILSNVSEQIPSLDLPKKYDEKANPPALRDRNMFFSSGFKYGFQNFALCIGFGTLLPNSILTLFGYTALAATLSSGLGLLVVIGISAAIGVAVATYTMYKYKQNSIEKSKEKAIACLKSTHTEKRIQAFNTTCENTAYGLYTRNSNSLFQATQADSHISNSVSTQVQITKPDSIQIAASAS